MKKVGYGPDKRLQLKVVDPHISPSTAIPP